MMKYEWKKIDDFTDVATGGTPSRRIPEYWDEGTIPWLNSGELNQDIITYSRNFITKKGLKNSSARMMLKDSVLVALTGSTTGKTAYLTFEACANQSVTGILPSKNHDSQYLYHFLKTQKEVIFRKAWGAAQPHISQQFVKDFKVPLPNLDNQKRIAQVLSNCESLIQKRKESIVLLDELLKSTFLEMFGDPNNNPKNYKFENFKKLAKSNNSDRIPIKKEDRAKINGKYPYYGSTGIVDYINDYKFSGEYLLISEDGKSLVSRNKPIAFIAKEKFWVNNHAHVLSDNGLSRLRYLEFHLNLMDISKYITGIDQFKLNKNNLESIGIMSVPLGLQNKFSTIVEKVESIRQNYQIHLQELKNLYASISQKAFKGELDLSKVNISDSSNTGSTTSGNLDSVIDIKTPVADSLEPYKEEEKRPKFYKKELEDLKTKPKGKRDITNIAYLDFIGIPTDLQMKYYASDYSIETDFVDEKLFVQFYLKDNFKNKNFTLGDVESKFNSYFIPKGQDFNYEVWKEYIFSFMEAKPPLIKRFFDETDNTIKLKLTDEAFKA